MGQKTTLAGVQICKDMFINTLQITPQKITVCLKKNRTGETIQDERGHNVAGLNKLPEDDINFAKNFIERVPKYVSHYRRNGTEREFLPPGTTLISLYDNYKTEFKSVPDKDFRTCLSFALFKKVFYDNFNLKVKTLKKDTCNRCDKYSIAKQNSIDQAQREAVTKQHEDHLNLADKLS
ncbi:unnamed protein product [Euphydryas editha]|uniref:Uncharacterized protein n=1 Tax=Euphydryas editha TaxID=104508 RepID=A0AAU9UNK3_EUPED|nr:unnamed protein product [Euphydryas editha]